MTSDKRKDVAIELITSVLASSKIQGETVGFSLPPQNIARAFLPYCMQRIASGRSLLLNRDYKPTGLSGYSQFAEYDDSKFASLCLNEEQIDRQFLLPGDYLFDDASAPWTSPRMRDAYFLRLWLVLQPAGMVRPLLPVAALKTAARDIGVSLDDLPIGGCL